MGFLGAGTIIRHGNVVRGLTTAASLWAVAAIGLCVGIGGAATWIAGIATLTVLLTLTVLRRLEEIFLPGTRVSHLTVRVTSGPGRLEAIRRALGDKGAEIESIEMSEVMSGGVQELHLRVLLPRSCDVTDLGSDLADLDGFIALRCE